MRKTPESPDPAPDARFGERVSKGYRVLWSVAYATMGNRDDAEDVLQDAVLIGFKKRDTFVPGTHFEAWMSRIIRNVAANARRSRYRRNLVLQLDSVAEPASPAGAGRAAVDKTSGQLMHDQHLFDDRVTSALRSLPATARACVLLRVVHDMDFATIGQTLSIPANTAMSHVHRARARLRQQLDEQPAKSIREGKQA